MIKKLKELGYVSIKLRLKYSDIIDVWFSGVKK